MNAEITNINLLYQRKARGVAPLSHFALSDDGTLIVSVPDEMEVRTFHIVRFDTTGKSKILETYSVETLRRTEIAASGGLYIGTTDDDLYLFNNAKKNRFLPDRRASYTDIALSQDGKRFGVAFCDLMASSHSVALGDTAGRLLWAKDIGFEINAVAVNRAVTHIAAGGASGDILLLDAARNTLYTHRHDFPVLLVATTGAENVAFASQSGAGLLDAQGSTVWFTEWGTGEPVGLAMDGNARTIAALIRTDESAGRLLFLNGDGLPVWDVDFDDARPTALSLSADGRFCAVTLRDGRISLFELEFGERWASVNTEQVLQEATQARDGGNFAGALDVLRARLVAVPSDVASADALAETLRISRDILFAQSQNAQAVQDFALADTRLADIIAQNPLDAEAVATRAALRHEWSRDAQTHAESALAAGDGQTAEACLLDAIAADPLNTAARQRLADARHAASESALAHGRALLQTGDFAASVAALTQAQTFGASGLEVTALLRSARAGEAMALGNKLYQDRQYAAALFQFKKALRFDPENADARQKLAYAQNFLQDTQINERFTRLE